jgi:Cu-Zn family superoxide dismutase
MRSASLTFVLSLVVVASAAGTAPSPVGTGVTSGVAVLAPTQGQQVRGTVSVRQDGDGVRVTGEVSGLTPDQAHGFHVHEFGDCSAPDAASAGGHFAPEAHPHGAPDPAAHHAGDLGNVQADATGRATLDVRVPGLAIASGIRALAGRSLVVHAQPDDLVTQPSGNAGARVACGVVQAQP